MGLLSRGNDDGMQSQQIHGSEVLGLAIDFA